MIYRNRPELRRDCDLSIMKLISSIPVYRNRPELRRDCDLIDMVLGEPHMNLIEIDLNYEGIATLIFVVFLCFFN